MKIFRLSCFIAALFSSLMPAVSGEFVIMNETVTLTSSNRGFYFVYNTNKGPINWVSPDNYRDGLVYFRFEILSQPGTKTNYLSFDIWGDYDPATNSYTESAAPISSALTGAGAVSTFSSRPSTWYANPTNGPVNFTDRTTFWRWGIVHWFSKNPNYLLAPQGWSNSPESWAAWETNYLWLPLTFKVIIVAVSQGSVFSGWDNYTGSAPLAPTNLTAGTVTSQSVQLNWTDNANNEQGFRIESRIDSNPTFTEIATVGANVQTYTHNGLSSGSLYHYRIRAYNADGNSNYSNILDVNTQNPLPPSQNPIAHYTFENSAADISGNGYNGTLVNGAAFSSAQIKEGSYSLQLDGTNDYVTIGTINLGDQFTFASWVYSPAGTSNIRTLIANSNSGANSNGFRLMVNTYSTTDRKIIFETGNGSQSNGASTPVSVYTFDSWNHVAVTVDKPNGTARIYYNGAEVTTDLSILTGFATNNPLRIGIMGNNTYPFRSNLDDLRLYNRVLSATEVATLAGSGPPPVTIPVAPGGLTAIGGVNSVSLSWSDNSTNEDGFNIQRSLSSGSGFSLLQTTAADAESYVDLTAQAGVTYYYRVNAFNSAGPSAFSNQSSATAQGPPTGGPIAHYTFENSAADISGNGHNGTPVNGASFSTARIKEGSYSLQLDGLNDYVNIGTINLGDQFTFASWVYSPSGTSNIRTLLSNSNSGANSNGFRLMVNTYATTDRKIIFETGNGSQSNSASTPVSVYSFDSWNHVAVTVDKLSGQARIYYNGTEVTTDLSILTGFATNNPLRIGLMGNNVFAFRSNLDDLRLYNHVLSASEIAVLAGSDPPVLTPSAPDGLTASGGVNSISLNWNDNSTNEDGFTIERSLTSGSGFGVLHTTAADAESYLDQTAQPGLTYYYRVKAFNGEGSSANSNEASAEASIQIPSNLNYIVMPLGNSLTSDDFTGDSRPVGLRPGYRQNLFLALEEYGYSTIDFTGSRSSGFNSIPDFDADHEGHPGFTAAQVADSVYRWLSMNPAGIILLEIGTNALQSSTSDVEAILDQIDLFEQDNNIVVKVLLAQISNRNVYSSLTTTFNNNLATLAANRVAAGDQVVLVDLENDAELNYALEPAGDMRDNIHPNQNGYNKIAQLWFDNILTVLPPVTANTPQAPAGLSTAAISEQSVALFWNDLSLIESDYSVERTDQGSSIFSVIATLPRNSRNYTDNTVVSGETYTYRVRAHNSAGYSGYSNESEITVQSEDPLSVGLIAHYTFENTAADITGNGHNGSLINGAGFSSSVKEGNFSLLLDGTNDYVDIGTINFGNQFTFASWVYIPTGSANIRTLIANTSSGSTRNGFKITVNQYATTDRKIIFETGNGTSFGYTLSPVSTFAFDSWNHVAVTADLTTGQSSIYYNGVDVTASSSILTNFMTNSPTRLGIMTNSVYPMRSNLDDTRLYSRVLSPSEILTLTTLPGLKSSSGANTTITGDEEIMIYPNPFTDHLNIRSDRIIKDVEVYTLLGMRIQAYENLNSNELIIEGIADEASVYIVKITTDDNKMHIMKVIKGH